MWVPCKRVYKSYPPTGKTSILSVNACLKPFDVLVT